ncbi:mediator of RNA polymerase II transcription subunit 9 [Pezoporus occidentalis]|uniref:mediator of RNA polymerase II transcription subunit 9 n=2 Tax=Pezoporus TaxID=35539 RepID=UPI002F915F97
MPTPVPGEGPRAAPRQARGSARCRPRPTPGQGPPEPAAGAGRGSEAAAAGPSSELRPPRSVTTRRRGCRPGSAMASAAGGIAARTAEEPPPSEPPAEPKPPPPPPQPPPAQEFSFLPLVHDIIKCMDKDSQDVHQVLNELKNKFQEMRKLISSMPGISVSPEQQQQQLQSLREQVRTKNELLQKYKSLCMFEIPKE